MSFTIVIIVVIVIVIVVAAAAIFAFARLNSQKRETLLRVDGQYVYEMSKPLTEPEQVMYFRLRSALPECEVLAQVTFSRFLKPSGKDAKRRFGALQRINKKSADFLICLKDFTIVAAVELDDASHNAEKDKDRDAILATAGVKVLRWHVRDLPSEQAIRDAFIH